METTRSMPGMRGWRASIFGEQGRALVLINLLPKPDEYDESDLGFNPGPAILRGMLCSQSGDRLSDCLGHKAMVFELGKATDDDRTDTTGLPDEYGEPTACCRILLLRQPVSLQERAPVHLCLDGHVEGAVVEALHDRPLAADPS